MFLCPPLQNLNVLCPSFPLLSLKSLLPTPTLSQVWQPGWLPLDLTVRVCREAWMRRRK